ncbi:glycoside hydrolase family 3 N-terminal domain-containing protein [Oerskovia sp. M15]
MSGSIAAAQTSGSQSQEVYTIVKHYNLNNQETRRGNVDAVVDERTLQEVYTRPWEKVVDDADAGAVMCAFNKVNGEYSCGNDELLNGILRTSSGSRATCRRTSTPSTRSRTTVRAWTWRVPARSTPARTSCRRCRTASSPRSA